MYIITGGAGFIGSAFVAKLNSIGIKDIIVVDELDSSDKWKNLVKRTFAEYIPKDEFLKRVVDNKLPASVKAVIHMGACSSTTENDVDYLMRNNTRYTQTLAEWAMAHGIRFIYASSAATYGDGALGYSDADADTPALRPLNPYGYSKQLFDLWALKAGALDKIVGLKFFNVFGPNEYHKGDMSSVVSKAFHQIRSDGHVRLFKSYKPAYADGQQLRDFVYIKDCIEVMWWLVWNPKVTGLFNLGAGKARSWYDLASAVFAAMGREKSIEYIDMPEEIRDRYQYFTEARMDKLRAVGHTGSFRSLEDAVKDYVENYLSKPDPYL